jgi:hypothetical protein
MQLRDSEVKNDLMSHVGTTVCRVGITIFHMSILYFLLIQLARVGSFPCIFVEIMNLFDVNVCDSHELLINGHTTVSHGPSSISMLKTFEYCVNNSSLFNIEWKSPKTILHSWEVSFFPIELIICLDFLIFLL